MWALLPPDSVSAFFILLKCRSYSCFFVMISFVSSHQLNYIFFQNSSSEDASGFFVSLLFGLGPLLGGLVLVAFALAFRLKHALLMGAASGIAFILVAWRPLQLLVSSKMGFFPIVFLLFLGAAFVHVSSSSILKIVFNKRTSSNNLPSVTGFPVSVITLQSFLACGAVAFHALAEGLALGVAAPKAYGLGRHMVLPVSLHGLPRGAAVASCIFGATDSWHGSLAAAALIGFVGPISAIGSIDIGRNRLQWTGPCDGFGLWRIVAMLC